MSNDKPRIFMGTMILDRGRFSKDAGRTLVSEWTQRIHDDGFDGMELWGPHGVDADQDELDRLRSGPAPVSLFNSYAGVEPEDAEGRKRTAELAEFFDCEGMKFNFGRDFDREDVYVDVVKEWYTMFKPGYLMHSENHRGTITADADVAVSCYKKIGDLPVGGIIHFQNGEDAYRERFTKYGHRLWHIHSMLSNEEGPMPEADVRQRVEWLREFNFKGTFTIEFCEGVRKESNDIETIYRNAVRDFNMLRKCLDEG